MYLDKLELLNKAGYFVGLNNKEYYDVLVHNYKTGNEDEKKFLDENADLCLDRYRLGIVQNNMILKEIEKIYRKIYPFWVLLVINVIGWALYWIIIWLIPFYLE